MTGPAAVLAAMCQGCSAGQIWWAGGDMWLDEAGHRFCEGDIAHEPLPQPLNGAAYVVHATGDGRAETPPWTPAECPFLTCTVESLHAHPICPACQSVRYGNGLCGVCVILRGRAINPHRVTSTRAAGEEAS